MSKKSNQEILDIIQCSTGTTAYHKFSPVTALVATDGVIALAQAAECYWLLDIIASYQYNRELDPAFQVWKLTVNAKNRRAIIRGYNDSGEKPIVTQCIDYTDFPLDEIKLYVCNGVILLPSEY